MQVFNITMQCSEHHFHRPVLRKRFERPVNSTKSWYVRSKIGNFGQIRSPELLRSLDREVTVEGFYYAGSIPMIIDDIRRTYDNIEMPTDSYIPLVGLRPVGIKSGDRISVTGVIWKPRTNDPKAVMDESVIIQSMNFRRISASEENRIRTATPIDRLKDRVSSLPPIPDKKIPSSSADRLRDRMRVPSAEKIEALGQGVMHPQRKFAVLIAGGGNYAESLYGLSFGFAFFIATSVSAIYPSLVAFKSSLIKIIRTKK